MPISYDSDWAGATPFVVTSSCYHLCYASVRQSKEFAYGHGITGGFGSAIVHMSGALVVLVASTSHERAAGGTVDGSAGHGDWQVRDIARLGRNEE